MITRRLVRQLGRPAGLFGRFFLAPLWNRRNVALNEAALARLALSPPDRVLEVGFGGGYLLGRMIPQVVAGLAVGLDSSPTMVAGCSRRFRPLGLSLCCGRAEALPYPAGHFTKAVTVNSIFYWDNAPLAIAELGRVLATGGTLVVCFTARESLTGKRFSRYGLTLYDGTDVERMMRRAGLDRIDLTMAADKHRQFWLLVGQK